MAPAVIPEPTANPVEEKMAFTSLGVTGGGGVRMMGTTCCPCSRLCSIVSRSMMLFVMPEGTPPRAVTTMEGWL